MDEIQKKLDLLGWTMDTLIKHLNLVYQKKLRDREKHRKYFEKNKKRLYEYHAKYRKTHPRRKSAK